MQYLSIKGVEIFHDKIKMTFQAIYYDCLPEMPQHVNRTVNFLMLNKVAT